MVYLLNFRQADRMVKIDLRNPSVVFFFFVITSVILRFFSFFPAVLDHDESTYMIIGRDILHGKSLYADVTDTKPVGIFLFYASLEFLFGSSIFMKRLVFAVLVGVTGFLIYRFSGRLFKNQRVALASGIIYILYVSIWIYHGLSPNTELLFNLITVSSLLFFLKQKVRFFILGGLLMGIGFMIKYLVLFDFGAFLLFFFISEMRIPENRVKGRIWLKYILSGFFFLLPFALTNLYFWLGDHFNDFKYITYELPGNYGGRPSLLRYLVMLLDLTAKFLPISFIVFYVVFKKNKPFEKSDKWFFSLWILFVLIAMYVPGQEFSHYTIQLMLPLSILAGLFFHPEFRKDKYTGKIFSGKTGLTILAILLFGVQVLTFQNEFMAKDHEREVADYISLKRENGDKVYVSNYHQIVYYLLGLESPTKYVHSNILFTENANAFLLDTDKEIDRIFSTQPRFVIVHKQNNAIEKRLVANYRLVKTFDNEKIKLYEKIITP